MLEIKPDNPLEEAPQAQTPPSGRVRRFFRRLFKWLLVLAIIGGLGAAVYYGWPAVRERFVDPVEVNTAEVGALQDRLIEMAAQVAALESEVAALEGQIGVVADGQAELGDRIGASEALIAGHTARLEELAGLQAQLEAVATSDREGVARQISMLRSMELLSRARLFLFEANYGLARQDVAAARNILAAVPATEADAEVLAESVFRLNRTLDNLPDRPVVAANDLDIAWAVLLGEIPPPPVEPTEETPATTTPTTAP